MADTTASVKQEDALLLPCLCPRCGKRFALKAVAVDPAAAIHPDRPKPWRCQCGHCGKALRVKV